MNPERPLSTSARLAIAHIGGYALGRCFRAIRFPPALLDSSNPASRRRPARAGRVGGPMK